jgi:ribosomal protein S8
MLLMNALIKVLCHIKNAQEARKPFTKIPFSKFSWRLLQILLFNGYIQGFTLKNKYIFIFLKYFNNEKTIKKYNVFHRRPSECMFLGKNSIRTKVV